MKKRTRRILFWIAVIAFGCLTWVVVKYAQGYVYDVRAHAFVRTGAVAVTVSTSAILYVNDSTVGSTSFIGNRAGKDGLLPGTYTIRVLRDDFSSWKKTVQVQGGMLSDFPRVLILPTDDVSRAELLSEASRSFGSSLTLRDAAPKVVPRQVRAGDFILRGMQLLDMRTASASVVAENVLGVALTGNNSKILWWTRNEVWVLWLRNTDYQPFRTENERQMITRLSVPIVRASWFRDEDHILVDVGGQNYRVIETDSRGGTNVIKI